VRRTMGNAYADKALYEQVLHRYLELYSEGWCVKTRPYDGIPELLERLKADGIKIAVCSNKPHATTVQVVDRFFPAGTFDLVLGQREGIPVKPDPAGPQEILRQLNESADNTFYLGDTNTDMFTARNAGFFACGVLWGFRGREELLASGADALISRASELLGIG